jgi:cytochrome c oxidase subunit 2
MMHVLETGGPQAAQIVDLLRITVALCTAVFGAVLIAFFYALIRGARDTQHEGVVLPSAVAQRRAKRGVTLAVSVASVLLVGLIVVSVLTDRALSSLDTQGAVRIEVTAHQWWWELRYDDPDPSKTFSTANELHVPVGRPVVLTLRSDDVIHSFWVPSLHGKRDLIPGRTTTHALRADVEGRYLGRCAEFCGAQHAFMAFELIAEPQERYDAWAQRQRTSAQADPAHERGRTLFTRGSCAMCHTITGTDAAGRHAPDLTHLASRQRIASGTLPNTPDALAQWISDPHRFKPGVNMPANAYSPDDLHALVAFLGSLQ